jgi:hypothetical protein
LNQNNILHLLLNQTYASSEKNLVSHERCGFALFNQYIFYNENETIFENIQL